MFLEEDVSFIQQILTSGTLGIHGIEVSIHSLGGDGRNAF
jgi:hypothetical protein